jgi:hypothetical protein
VAKPTSNRPNKRALQKALPSKGAGFPAAGTATASAPERTAAWTAPDQLGNSSKRLRGIERVKTRMWERG